MSGYIINIGIATHYLGENKYPVCGVPGAEYTTTDLKKVDCLRCRRTKAFKEARRKAKGND